MWVDVAADQHLVGEAICAALRSRGVSTELVDWMATDAGVSPAVPLPRIGDDDPLLQRLLLVVCDLDAAGRTGEACDLGRGSGSPWLVVDASGPGPAWGALLAAGASAVIGSVTLDELVDDLDVVAAGGSPLTELERRALIRQWRLVRGAPEQAWRQMLSVNEHDREILTMLYEGTTVQAVADRFDVSEAAVRSQVKAVLRRLSSSSGRGDR